MHRALDHLEPETFVHALRKSIADYRVRSHLRATLASRPFLGGSQQAFANSPLPVTLRNVPALDVPHRAGRMASLGVRAQTGFQEADQRSVPLFRNEDDERQRSRRLASKNEFQFLRVLLDG